MIPTELVLRNFMCYRDDLDPLRFDGLHVACLSGENGAGKSALLDAITWALWGKARMSDDDLIAQGEVEMQVELCFELGSQRYRVIRKRQRGKTGPRGGAVAGKSHLDLQVRGEQGWRPCGETTLVETERKIEQLLRMRYETFINASFLLQGRADEFTSKTAAERKQVLADILDLGEYAALEERAKARVKRLEDEIKGLEGKIESLQQKAEQLPLYTQCVAEAEQRAAALAAGLEAAEAARAEANAAVQSLETKAARHKDLAARRQQLQAELQDQEQQIADLRLRIDQAEALLERRAEINAGLAALAAARDEQQRLERLRPRYDELREQWRQLQDALKDEKRRLQSELDGLERERRRLASLAGRRPQVEATLADLEGRLAELAPLADELRALREQAGALDQRLSRANALLLRQRELVSQIEKRQDSLVAVREEQKRIVARLQRQLADAPRWRQELDSALAGQRAAAEQTERLAAMRDQERALAEQIGELRAHCAQFKQQADQIKRDRERLATASTTSCPLCRSELGHDGIGHVLAHYDEETAGLRERYRVCNQQAKELDGQLAALREQLRGLEAQLGQSQQEAARAGPLQQRLAQAAEDERELEQAHVRLADVDLQLSTEDYELEARAHLAETLAELKQLGIEAPAPGPRRGGGASAAALEGERDEVRRRCTALERRLDGRPQLEGQAAAARRELEELARAAADLPAVEQRLAALAATIERDDYAHETRAAQQAIQDAAQQLGYSDNAHNAASDEARRLAHWEAKERALREAEIRLESDRQQLEQAGELRARRSAEVEQLAGDIALLDQELCALPAARARVQECDRAVADGRRNLGVAQRDLGEKQSMRDSAAAAAEQLLAEQTQRRALEERRGVFKELQEAFGKKGVQAMLIETAIPQIEDEANRLLGRMTDNQMHVTFEMQRDTKKGDTVETLEIKIADTLGTRIYDAFSGGEAMRVNFAIRVALSRLLARRAGASLETLVIDEGFGALDAAGRERFVEAITSVQQDFRRILVITHIEELKDRFPALIEVTKTPRGSRWELR